MSKPVKSLMSDTIRARCEGVDSACVIDLSGLDAVNTNLMRGELKKQNIRMHIVKNSMARRALVDSALAPLANALEGPCALVHGDAAITDIAKELAKWAKQHKAIGLRIGIIEGDPDLFTVEQMSKMLGRRELTGTIAMLISSPGGQIAGALRSPAAGIAACLETLSKKGEAA